MARINKPKPEQGKWGGPEMPAAAHVVYIPGILLLGIVLGFLLGGRAARDEAAGRAARDAAREARRSGATPSQNPEGQTPVRKQKPPELLGAATTACRGLAWSGKHLQAAPGDALFGPKHAKMTRSRSVQSVLGAAAVSFVWIDRAFEVNGRFSRRSAPMPRVYVILGFARHRRFALLWPAW